jgi:hypothetical protein
VIDRRLADDYTKFCSHASEAEGLVNKFFTKENTKKAKSKM